MGPCKPGCAMDIVDRMDVVDAQAEQVPLAKKPARMPTLPGHLRNEGYRCAAMQNDKCKTDNEKWEEAGAVTRGEASLW